MATEGMSDEGQFFAGVPFFKGPGVAEKIGKLLDLQEKLIGAQLIGAGNQMLIPEADRCRARPAMVQRADGSAVIYFEIVITEPTVHLMMTSHKGLEANCGVLASDAAQVLYDYVLRARGAYFEGRKQQ